VGTPPPPPPPPKRERRLERSEDDRVIAGVCGGIGAYLGSDPTWVRIAWIIITLLTSVMPMVIIYILLAAVLPTAPSTKPRSAPESGAPPPPYSTAESGRAPWGVVFGALLLAVGGLLLVAQFIPLRWDVIWPVSLIVVGAVVIVIALRQRSGGPS
jgi:phage shock protein C